MLFAAFAVVGAVADAGQALPAWQETVHMLTGADTPDDGSNTTSSSHDATSERPSSSVVLACSVA